MDIPDTLVTVVTQAIPGTQDTLDIPVTLDILVIQVIPGAQGTQDTVGILDTQDTVVTQV